MSGALIALIIVGVILLLIIMFVISTYNSLIKLRNMVKDQWSQIDVLLKRRADLIPNLVETVKGYASHEKETLDAVITARNKVASSSNTHDEMVANNELTGALSRLFALSEAYPDLKANTNFLDLQANLKDTEDKRFLQKGIFLWLIREKEQLLRRKRKKKKLLSNLPMNSLL